MRSVSSLKRIPPVLGRDQDRVDGHRPVVLVDHAHLGLAIGEQVAEGAVVTHFRQAAGQFQPRQLQGDEGGNVVVKPGVKAQVRNP